MPILTTSHADTGHPAFEDHNGEVRHLTRLMRAADVESRKKFAHVETAYPLVPRNQWANIDRRSQWATAKFILDQKSHGSCVGFSGAGALQASRDLAGMDFNRLSGAYIYSFINGGHDNGASIVDAMSELTDHGTCLDATVSWDNIYRNGAKVGDQEAQRFKLAGAYAIDNSNQATAFDWVCSAIQTGLIPQFAIEVGNNFESFDANGVAGYSNGYGNHSVMATGMLQINGTWYLLMQNSWNLWGPFKNGYCLLSEKHIMGVVNAGGQDAFVHLDEVSDPQDPTVPHVPQL